MSISPPISPTHPILPSPPALSYTSIFASYCHPEVDIVVFNAQSYFLANWPWRSEAEKDAFINSRIERSGALTLPFALRERVEVVARWYAWGFLFDDMLEINELPTTGGVDKKTQIGRYAGLILGKILPDPTSPVETITYDVHQAFLNTEDEDSREAGRVHLQEMAKWVVETFKYAASPEGAKRIETTEGMIERRMVTSAGWTLWHALRWANSVFLPASAFEDPTSRIHRVHYLANMHIILVNDMFSYRKEVNEACKSSSRVSCDNDEGDQKSSVYVENVVSAMMKMSDVSEDEAFREAAERLRIVEEEIRTLGDRLYDEADSRGDSAGGEMMKRYVENLQAYLAGTIAWSKETGRYVI